jgi:hypothetical protein
LNKAPSKCGLLRIEVLGAGSTFLAHSPWWKIPRISKQDLHPDLGEVEGNRSLSPAHIDNENGSWVLVVPDHPEAREWRLGWSRPAGTGEEAEVKPIEVAGLWRAVNPQSCQRSDWNTGQPIQGRQQYPSMAQTVRALEAGSRRPSAREIPFEIDPVEGLEVRDTLSALRACLKHRTRAPMGTGFLERANL